AEFAETAGANAAPGFERAYSEDSRDPQIALAYGKSLLAQGEIGAAIFIFETHVQAGNPSLELRDHYAKALLAANRLIDAEALVLLLFDENLVLIVQLIALCGHIICSTNVDQV